MMEFIIYFIRLMWSIFTNLDNVVFLVVTTYSLSIIFMVLDEVRLYYEDTLYDEAVERKLKETREELEMIDRIYAE